MKRNRQILLTSTAILFSMSIAMATATHPGPRQGAQHARIAQGIASGELNHREALQLKAQQTSVQCHKNAARADGVITRQEARQIDRHQDRASRNIYRKKHNPR